MNYVSLAMLLAAMVVVSGCSSAKSSPAGMAASSTAGIQARVIDVRTPEEFASGHIEGALNLPLNELESKITTVAPEKTAPLMVHCRSGSRSARAKALLVRLGYTQVTDLGSLAHAREVVEGR